MTRPKLLLALVVGTFTLTAVPFVAAKAQSGDALANAERACLDNGVRPGSTTFELCVKRAGVAFDRGMPGAAYREVARIADARENCLSYGLHPRTLGYQECLNNERERRPVRYIARTW